MGLSEGQDMGDDPAVLIAICCAADISAGEKSHLLHVNNEDYSGPPFENFVFVDSLTFKHTAPDLEGDEFEASSPNSPFKGKNVTECSALLKRLAEQTGAYILDTVFAIYDVRSTQDESLLLVQTIDDELEAMRVVPELTCTKLLQYMICDASITEDREDAEEEEDGTFRINEVFLD